ncbi:hypothetical protein UlMin_032955 [Ulmus minor]
MAEIVLPPILQVFLDKLASPALEMFSNMLDIKDNCQKLQSTLPMVQELLEDAEEQQATSLAVRIWLSKFQGVALEAEELLLDFTISGARITDAKCADKVRKMLNELEKVSDEGLRLNLRESSRVHGQWFRRETSSFVVESEVYGREEDKEKVVELLLSCEANQKRRISGLAIVGMGGLGKTTLAQLAYNDEKVTQRFDVKIWVFVSSQFDVKNIMMSIIVFLTKDRCHYSNMDALHSEVFSLLRKKRYLIVLDDIWTEDLDDWDKLRPLFNGDVGGSKILITTRSTKVAQMMDCQTFLYQLKGLPEEACWSLFKQCAFQRGEEEEHPNLLPIGEKIVRKCGGVALAAKTLGRLMRFKREEREWLFVQESEIWDLDESESGILPALRLSYSHLPPQLKRCFLFCSVFPRSYEIKKEKLIHLWMAEGLVQFSKGKQLEDIGNEYFNDLLWMSFFQEIKHSHNGGVTRYEMHDVIYYLAQSIAGSKYNAILDRDCPAPSSFEQIRHASVVSNFHSSSIPTELYEATRLRTLLMLSGGNFTEVSYDLYTKFKYLLVLDLSGSSLLKLDVSIGLLVCLRYLDLSHTHIKYLPFSLENLHCLQTLNLFNCFELEFLPNILRMRNLRHLKNDGCKALTSTLPFPSRRHLNVERDKFLNALSRYQNELQTLSLFVIGGPLDIMLLGQLSLQGSLKITHIENACIAGRASLILREKRGIESLGLYWGSDDQSPNINPEEESEVTRLQKANVAHSSGSSQGPDFDASLGESVDWQLQLPPNLKRLLIKGYPGAYLPSWGTSYLKRVDLIGCRRLKLVPTLGGFQFLESLSMQAIHVRLTGQQFYGPVRKPFPALKELVLVDFPSLEEWSSPVGREAFPCLNKLVLKKCPKLNVVPLINSIQHLELQDCTATLVHSFHHLTSLKTLVVERVTDLFTFSGSFPANSPLLTSLKIKSCPQLHSLPSELGSLTALKSLTLRWCEELSSLPQTFQNLNALESLEISDCHRLTSLPEDNTRGLSSLRTLSIENCNNLSSLSMGLQFLTSLEHLTIMYCPSLGSLPQGLEHLVALRSLTILSCPEISSLPEGLQNLMVLHSLEIRSCPGLKALPEWIKKLVSLRSLAISDCHDIRVLPAGLKSLTSLQHLSILDCPLLVQRCGEQSGEDWPKIAHIPYKHIGASEQRQPNSGEASNSSTN